MILILLYHKLMKYPSSDLWWKTFDLQLSILKKTYRVLSLEEALEYLHRGVMPDRKCVVITFDDGYADNYVYAYPLLKKHGLRATLFVATSRIQPTESKRKTLLDYWEGRVSFRELFSGDNMFMANKKFVEDGQKEQFLTVGELRAMRDVFEFGWHSVSHVKTFSEERLLGFFTGKGHWSLAHSYGEKPRKGFPLFPLSSNLVTREGRLKREVKEMIKSLPKKFFQRRDWESLLRRELYSHFSSLIEWEEEESFERRKVHEVEKAIEDLSGWLDTAVSVGAYPFGEYNQQLVALCKKYLKAALTTEKAYVKEDTDMYRIPRVTVPRDMWSFMGILIKFLRAP